MMNFEVRGWMTNHEAGIGTHEFGGRRRSRGGFSEGDCGGGQRKRSLGPASGAPSTIGNLYYGSEGYLAISNYDSYKSFLGAAE